MLFEEFLNGCQIVDSEKSIFKISNFIVDQLPYKVVVWFKRRCLKCEKKLMENKPYHKLAQSSAPSEIIISLFLKFDSFSTFLVSKISSNWHIYLIYRLIFFVYARIRIDILMHRHT